MKRLLLGVLLVGLAILLIPSLRMRMQPGIDRFREAAGERLEGPMSPLLNPYRTMATRSEMSRITNRLVQMRNMGFPRPAPDDFQAFVRQRVEGEDGLDRWGSPYIILPTSDSVTVVSPGPDLTYGSDDDVTAAIRYRAPQRGVRRRPR